MAKVQTYSDEHGWSWTSQRSADRHVRFGRAVMIDGVCHFTAQIRPLRAQPNLEIITSAQLWEPCWRTIEASVLPPPPDWADRMGYRRSAA